MSDNADESWKGKWQAAVDAVGSDLSDGQTRWGVDRVELSTLRRLIEPIEINTLIHTDEDAAKAAGYDAIVAPAFGALAFTMPPMWQPGDDELYADTSRNAQPSRSPINNQDPAPAPRTQGFFATDLEIDFVRPVVMGERLGTRGRKLLSCDLKETSVGRGGFMKFESEIVSDKGDVVARLRTGTFAFDPIPRDEAAASAAKGA